MGISRTKEEVETDLKAREAELRAGARSVEGEIIPPPGTGDIAANPQVQALIAKAVAEAMAPLVAQLQEKRGGDLGGGDRQFLEGLALAIHQLTDQGKPDARRMVAPEVLKARAESRQRMVDALLAARSRGEEPEYEVIAPTYLADEIVMPFVANNAKAAEPRPLNPWERSEATYGRTRIGWPGVPNEALRPTNDVAREIHKHFLDSIGGGGVAVVDDPLSGGLKRLEADGLKVRDRSKPVPVRILGTIAEPAQGQF